MASNKRRAGSGVLFSKKIPEYMASVTAQPSCGIEEHAASILEQPLPFDVVNYGESISTSESPSYPFPDE